MGLKKFFKKIGGWVKDKFHKATHAVGKVVGKAVPVVKKVVNFVDKTPIGGIVNSFTGGLFDKAKKVINLIPDGKVKDTLNNYTNKAEEFKNKAVDEINKRQDQARGLIDKGRDLIDRGKQAASIITAPAPKPNM